LLVRLDLVLSVLHLSDDLLVLTLGLPDLVRQVSLHLLFIVNYDFSAVRDFSSSCIDDSLSAVVSKISCVVVVFLHLLVSQSVCLALKVLEVALSLNLRDLRRSCFC